MPDARQRGRGGALLVGAALTGIVLALAWAGIFERAELATLDLRFRYANSITMRDDLVRIDIDDGSLERVGRWPWPRQVQAALISIPAELGARAILVDLTWLDPQPIDLDAPRNADVLQDPLTLSLDVDAVHLADLELAAALREAGEAYLAFHYVAEDTVRSARFDAIVARLRARPSENAQPTALPDAASDLFICARLVVALEADPQRTTAELAAQLNLRRDAVRRWYETARQYVLREHIRAWFAADPQRWQRPPVACARALYAQLTDTPFENDTPLKAALSVALREVLGYEAMRRSSALPLGDVGSARRAVDGCVPVYFQHAAAAERCGFVVFEPDIDGVTRRMRLLVRHRGDDFGQLAFVLAGDLMGAGWPELRAAGRALILPTADQGQIRIPLDREGHTLIPWARATGAESARHIPADAIWEIVELRRQIAENRRVIRDTLERSLANPFFEDNATYQQLLAESKRLCAAREQARLTGNTQAYQTLSTQLDTLEGSIARREDAMCQSLESEYRRLRDIPPGEMTPQQELAFDTADWIRTQLLSPTLDNCRKQNALLNQRLNETRDKLHARLQGRICLVGYTATALADMTPTPLHRRAPGIYAHQHLLNGLLSHQFVTPAPPTANVILVVAAGLVASLISAWRTPRLALLLNAFLLLALATAATALFHYGRIWSDVIAPAVAVMLAFVGIVVFRFLFVERERRQLTTALGQYTSATLARQMAEKPDLCRIAETREVTAMFTDLAGFTTISEEIGAEATQRVLNTTLGLFSDVILKQEGMINKFIGDGIFAFWNPVIYPQSDHARRACAAAVTLQNALREFVQRVANDEQAAVYQRLVVRVGVATGRAVVGPCGSEQKYDYTCIGDSVNVAARLESANKFYGTRILVSGATRDAAGDEFVYRPLGGVQVKGKRAAVPIFELLGQAGDVIEADRVFAERFGAAVTNFQNRDWLGAIAGFESCTARRPDDRATRAYLEAARSFAENPPAPDWHGALTLTEK